jgi:uncharacterized protein (DUF924 family)
MEAQLLDCVYRFWFGDLGDAEILPEARVRYWMMGGEATDEDIRERFGDHIAKAAAVSWPVESLSREQSVALVVLFDQFPRNCHRSSGEAFAYDHLARDLVRELEATEWSFTAAERFFLGLPYVHHEDMASQDRAVYLAARELDRAPAAGKQMQRGNLDQAIRHRHVIQRFGRFPHRNAVLGRPSTAEELSFMATAINGRGF